MEVSLVGLLYVRPFSVRKIPILKNTIGFAETECGRNSKRARVNIRPAKNVVFRSKERPAFGDDFMVLSSPGQRLITCLSRALIAEFYSC